MNGCRLCPLKCGTNRNIRRGSCGANNDIEIGFIGAHFGEEPPIVGKRGSGAVFFSGCPLKCVFCQNADISVRGGGKVYSLAALEKELLTLAETCENINLVTAGHYLDLLIPVLKKIKPRITVPVVYNSGGYETVEAVKRMEGLIDVWLPDYKYFDPSLAEKYSGRKDYPEVARAAINEMVRQQPDVKIKDGTIRRGVIIRHLVLPSHRDDSFAVIHDIAYRWGERVNISLMSQYTPEFNRSDYAELNRKVTSFEYNSVVEEALRSNLKGFMQQRSSATSLLTPKFIKS